MDPPTVNVEVAPKEEDKIEDGKEKGLAFHCQLCDAELVYKIAQIFLPGLASACIDSTTGDMFRSPASVAVDIRQEMINYITQRSESFVAESVILEGTPDMEVSDHPYDIIADFVDDFASSKRNLFSRVSEWLLSDKREDKIDDFVQEMDLNAFWSMDRREAVAQNLLKNVDFKNTFHCDMKFNTAEELAEHVENCGFRSLNCQNDGCIATYSARQEEKHDSTCPFKVIPCEQKCPEYLMRREMDKHCITVCPMKLVNCAFYSVGCRSTVPRSMMQQHNSDDLNSHLLCVLKLIHKGAPEEDLKLRVDQIVAQSSSDQLRRPRDARSLTHLVKDIEVKLGPLEIKPRKESSEPSTEATNNDKNTTQEINTGDKESTLSANKSRELPTLDVSKEIIEAVRKRTEQNSENMDAEVAKGGGERGTENSVPDMKDMGDSSKASENPTSDVKISVPDMKYVGDSNKASENHTSDVKISGEPTECVKESSQLSTEVSIPDVNVIEDSTKANKQPTSHLNKVSEEPTETSKYPTSDLNKVGEEPSEDVPTRNSTLNVTVIEEKAETAKKTSEETTFDENKIENGISEDFSTTIDKQDAGGSIESAKTTSESATFDENKIENGSDANSTAISRKDAEGSLGLARKTSEEMAFDENKVESGNSEVYSTTIASKDTEASKEHELTGKESTEHSVSDVSKVIEEPADTTGNKLNRELL